MSKNKIKNNISNKVSNLKENKLFDLKNEEIEKYIKKEHNSLYEKFFNDYNYTEKELQKLNIKKLEEIYEDGHMILSLFYEDKENKDEKSNISQEDIIEIQYVISNVLYVIQDKRYKENNLQSKAIIKKINDTTKQYNEIQNNIKRTNYAVKKVQNDVNSVLTTIISIVLSISIITAAIAGIERINPNYILPFTTSIIFFGMVMILFIYSIYKGKIPIKSYALIVVTAIMVVFLWISSINKWYDISNIKIENETSIEKMKSKKKIIC